MNQHEIVSLRAHNDFREKYPFAAFVETASRWQRFVIRPYFVKRQSICPDNDQDFCASTMSCHSRGGVSGSSRGSTPSDDSAAATAFASAPPTGMIPPSPAPLAPSGLFGEGCASSDIARTTG